MEYGHARSPDETPSHSTRLPNDVNQVAGYLPSSPPLAGERDAVSLCESGIKLPLAGLKILVTRPRDQAIQLAGAIEQAGGVPLLFPLLEIAPVQDTQVLKEQISHLGLADLAIFISPNAVQYGMAAIRGTLSPNPSPVHGGGGRDSAGEGGFSMLPPALKVATVGPGSAKALRELGVKDVIVPDSRFDSEGLLAQLQNVKGWRVMIFRGDGGRELLGDTLKARGATVEYVTCYLRRKPQQPAGQILNANAITVTSSEALSHLSQMLDEPARKHLFDTPLFVPHPRIAELARSQGWVDVHLTGAGDEGLLSALLEWAKSRSDAARPQGPSHGI